MEALKNLEENLRQLTDRDQQLGAQVRWFERLAHAHVAWMRWGVVLICELGDRGVLVTWWMEQDGMHVGRGGYCCCSMVCMRYSWELSFCVWSVAFRKRGNDGYCRTCTDLYWEPGFMSIASDVVGIWGSILVVYWESRQVGPA